MIPVKSIISDFSHLFFPHVCAGCGTDNLNSHSPVCLCCISQLPLTNFYDYAGNPVEKNFWGRIPVEAAASLYHFTDGSLVQRLLHQLKYRGRKELGFFLGSMMGNAIQGSDRFRDIDIIIPLPLFAARQRKRGYNQAAVLSEGMAGLLQKPVAANLVKRLAATATQTHKNRIERWVNMEGKFELVNPAAVEGRHVLLVDDVITTGATLEACGQEILKMAGTKLSIATLAYTV
ncbi:MAG: phosphoribosyltransferase family protein [Bacteroidota bacterium]